jgi:hypothetical protein
VIIIGVGLTVLAAVLGWMAVSEMTGNRLMRNVLAALTLAALIVLVALGSRTGSVWMVVVGGVEFAILGALALLAPRALPSEQSTRVPELASSLATFAASPDSRALHLAVYRDGSISASRGSEGDRLPRLTRYRLTDASCPHCVVEQQILAIISEHEGASAAVDAYRGGTLEHRTMEVLLRQTAGVDGWTVRVNATVGRPNFDHACFVHRSSWTG